MTSTSQPATKSPAIVAVSNVSKRFGVVQALSDISIAFHPGEVLGLVGENGAGKSTLTRILEGVYRPDSGEVRVDGNPVTFGEPRDAHRTGIRIIHQEPEIVPELTVAENIFMGDIPRVAGVFLDWRKLERQTHDILADFGMSRDLSPRQLCTGLGPAQRQVLEIMRAIRAGGRLIAFDEPTSSLTDDEARRLFQVVRRLRDDGVSVVYISHRLNEIVDLADRVVVLRDGRLVADRPAEGVDEAEIGRLMVGRDVGSLFSRRRQARTDVALRVTNLTTAAIDNVSLEVRAGEVLGIGGLMGAGRSELAKAIVGFDRRVSGAIHAAGKAVRPNSPADAILAGIGLAPEDRKQEALLLFRSVLDNATLCIPDKVSRFGFFQRGRAQGITQNLADRLSIRTPNLDQPVSRLSGGNQQKVVLARWLAREPRVLILDEPTRGIDVGAKAEIYQLIDELAAAGIALIVISSEMPELLGLADRIIVMAGGRIVGELDRAEAFEDAILRLAMHTAEPAPELKDNAA
ncbi:MAG: sugar ABC transporter ATP-binding protein [Rhizobiales bacterium]|nr:sugar ABC transporter ATP-binding protein [Hyphomicrobiales bacterium]